MDVLGLRGRGLLEAVFDSAAVEKLLLDWWLGLGRRGSAGNIWTVESEGGAGVRSGVSAWITARTTITGASRARVWAMSVVRFGVGLVGGSGAEGLIVEGTPLEEEVLSADDFGEGGDGGEDFLDGA